MLNIFSHILCISLKETFALSHFHSHPAFPLCLSSSTWFCNVAEEEENVVMFCDVERRKKGNRNNNKMMVKVIVSSQMAFSSSSFYAVLPLCMCVRVLQCKGWVLNCRPSIVPRHVIYNICLLLTTIVNPLFVGWMVGDDEYFLSFLSLPSILFTPTLRLSSFLAQIVFVWKQRGKAVGGVLWEMAYKILNNF